HGNTNRPGVDPDAYPTLREHRQSFLVRVSTDCFGIGRSRWRGLTSLLIGFHAQSIHVLLFALKRRYLGRREQALALLETLCGVAVWAGLAAVAGPTAFLFGYVLPALVGNAIVMGYIF